MSKPAKPWHYTWREIPHDGAQVWIRGSAFNWPPVLATFDATAKTFYWVVEDDDQDTAVQMVVDAWEIHSWRAM